MTSFSSPPMMMAMAMMCLSFAAVSSSFVPHCRQQRRPAVAFSTTTTTTTVSATRGDDIDAVVGEVVSATPPSRRGFLASCGAAAAASVALLPRDVANAVGPVKVALEPISYKAEPCPPSRPIPGEKAMVGMRGLCVTVRAKLKESPPKDLEKVGVYGFVTDGNTGDSVLANNPDLSTDAGQFAMVEQITTKDREVVFDFVAAVPRELDTSKFDNGIGPLDFASLRVISFPGGQQYGDISPCEMNEFSEECDAWEQENGPYVKPDYMMKSNPRTKGR